MKFSTTLSRKIDDKSGVHFAAFYGTHKPIAVEFHSPNGEAFDCPLKPGVEYTVTIEPVTVVAPDKPKRRKRERAGVA